MTALVIAIITVGGALVLVFLLALCRAAGKPMPGPEGKDGGK